MLARKPLGVELVGKPLFDRQAKSCSFHLRTEEVTATFSNIKNRGVVSRDRPFPHLDMFGTPAHDCNDIIMYEISQASNALRRVEEVNVRSAGFS